MPRTNAARVKDSVPGLRYFLGFDAAVSYAARAVPRDVKGQLDYAGVRKFWLVLDPTLRVLANIPFAADGSESAELFRILDGLPDPARAAGIEVQAPVLLPAERVRARRSAAGWSRLYETQGGGESGFMRESRRQDRRWCGPRATSAARDCTIDDEALHRADAGAASSAASFPEISKAHQFNVTRMERYIVACYERRRTAAISAPHRDNTTKGTAHRRFAVSINLNDEFDGGEVSFPEYGRAAFKPPRRRRGGVLLLAAARGVAA